jgi:uncharacterized membrane protein
MAAQPARKAALRQGAVRAYFERMDAAAPVRLHLDEVIVPHRSLTPRGLFWVMAVLVTVNTGLAMVFVSMGAPPIPIFLGLDVLAVWIAFRISYRQARRRERVQVTADEVTVKREDDRRSATVWTSPTAFTRVELVEPTEWEAYVGLAVSGRRLSIGRSLGAEGRRTLARKVDAAIHAARRERHPA